MKKLFTLGEVQTLLPVLGSLMLRAQEAGLRAHTLEMEMDALRQRIFVSGGMLVDVEAVSRQRFDQNAALEDVKRLVGEIEEIGAQVHDLEEGLLDLPHRSETGEVMLCWKLGEPMVTHWHGDEEGETERRPLDQLFGPTGWKRLN